MRSSIVLAFTASLSTASAAIQGFNYGSTKTDGSFMFEADFKSKFSAAKNLAGASGFSSARLYTMIQGGSSTNEPTQAIPAAIAEDTSLLLGLWASGGQGGIEAEITALKSAITQYGDDFTGRVVGISVGSEDLYRVSPTGIAAMSGYGADPDTLVSYIGQVRKAIAGTSLSGAKIGHVDTWTAWVNGSNNAVAEACDWVGMDAYPYFQNSESNGIDTGKDLFNSALAATKGAVGGKDVWITETGWPVSGKTENLAIPSTDNAKTYWQEVGCPLFDNVNTWWFTLQDADPSTPNPSFGIVGSDLSGGPLFDLSCKDISTSPTTSAASKPTTSDGSSESSAPTTSPIPSPSSNPTDSGSASSEVSSAASSLSTAATGTDSGVVSSGGGLSPSQGGGIVVASSSGTAATPTGTGTGSNGTSVTTPTVSQSGSGSPTVSTTPNNAAIRTGSLFAAFGVMIVAVMTL